MMQHQYWITKKSVQRKLGGKEDDCIVSSDAELDAKLELFRSVSETCIQLQRIIDLYQERLCLLAQEENVLGRYLKECGKNEKNASAGHIMMTAGKAISYTGHQRLTVRPPLVRLHHEVETFRGRAISDTRITVSEMEKTRTEYRAALSWMKSVSTQLDPDSGLGLERFRKAQSYVKSSKARFDRLMLACLQKVDLLAAARCNMFSHALISYQNALSTFSTKVGETLTNAASKLDKIDPYEFSVVSELATPTSKEEKDKSTFFNSEYTDSTDKKEEKQTSQENTNEVPTSSDLLGECLSFNQSPSKDVIDDKTDSVSNVKLLEMNLLQDSDLLKDFMPSHLLQEENFNFFLQDQSTSSQPNEAKAQKNVPKKADDKLESQMSWLSLFKELDPLANQDNTAPSGDRA